MPSDIARRLSPAQARAVLWLPEDGSPAFPTEHMLAEAYRELHTLETFGLAEQQAWRWRALPLGLAVRAELVALQRQAGGEA